MCVSLSLSRARASYLRVTEQRSYCCWARYARIKGSDVVAAAVSPFRSAREKPRRGTDGRTAAPRNYMIILCYTDIYIYIRMRAYEGTTESQTVIDTRRHSCPARFNNNILYSDNNIIYNSLETETGLPYVYPVSVNTQVYPIVL